jgi:hypothetical protein
MKKLQFFGLLVCVLVLGMAVVDCSTTEPATSSEPVNLEGTWVGTRSDGSIRTIVITGNTLHRVEQNDDFTFEQTAKTLVFTRVGGKDDGKVSPPQGYKVSGNKLTLTEGSQYAMWGGPYTKQ